MTAVIHQQKYRELRKRFPVFVYKDFRYAFTEAGMEAVFTFLLLDENGAEAYRFSPTLNIPARPFYDAGRLSSAQWDTLVFHCGMVELISYWKAACSPLVRIECGALNKVQKDWFRKLYYNGLGEFFYVNGIEALAEDFMQMEFRGPEFSFEGLKDLSQSENVLVPIGGGKDSVVTLEILRSLPEVEVRPFIINPRGATVNCAAVAGFPLEECAVVNRTIHPQLLELNAQGFLNGHTPFSAMLAFTSLLVSGLTGVRHIALSNENSANESTVAGGANHQYSKSLEFENDFRAYITVGGAGCGRPAFNYFSFLRPLSELGIARLFSQYPQYHPVFRSCNVGSKTDSWCGTCPKCLFAFIILSPFMGIERCTEIFGKNLLNDISLKPYLEQLCGIVEVKPFECVGTRSEVNWALQQLKPFASGHALLEYYFSTPVSRIPQPDSLLEDFSFEKNLPKDFSAALHLQHCFATGDRPIAILGLGREGQSTYKLIRRLRPFCKLVLVDANEAVRQNPLWADDTQVEFITGPDYLKTLSNRASEMGLMMKTPGISLKDFPALNTAPNLSSQTDIFLKVYGRQTIGITGTKGKSTTTLLIHHLLSGGSRPCLLAGNMGIPFFDIIPQITPHTYIICELSCHQLEHVHAAPHIGVLLNLYEEHLDHYSSFLDYQNAKMNIFGRNSEDLRPGQVCIYNEEDPLVMARLHERFPSRNMPQMVPFAPSQAASVNIKGNPLIGVHNQVNFIVAYEAVQAAAQIETDIIIERLKTFQPLPHRLQYIGEVDGKHFFNDSISTIPQAAIAAVESISALPYIIGVDSLILGGMDRGIDYTPLEEYLQQDKVKSITFVGAAGKRMFEELQRKGYTPREYLLSDDYVQIVDWCKQHTRKGYACVLSPAAPSYDSFRNFEHRGEVFTALVKDGTEPGKQVQS